VYLNRRCVTNTIKKKRLLQNIYNGLGQGEITFPIYKEMQKIQVNLNKFLDQVLNKLNKIKSKYFRPPPSIAAYLLHRVMIVMSHKYL